MSQFAYIARATAGTSTGTPDGWPNGWQYPGDENNTPYPNQVFTGGEIPGIGWPPLWPPDRAANTVVIVDSPTQLSVSGSGQGSVEAYITVDGDESAASFYSNHLLQITATHNGNAVQCQGPNDGGMGGAATVKVTNYGGNRWGWSGTIDFNLTGLDISIDLIVEAELITATLPTSDTDNTDLIS